MFYHAQIMKGDDSHEIQLFTNEEEAKQFLQSFVDNPDVNTGLIFKSEDKEVWKMVATLLGSQIYYSQGSDVENKPWKYLGDGKFNEIMFYHAQITKEDGSHEIQLFTNEEEAKQFLQSFVDNPGILGMIFKSEDKEVWKMVAMLFCSQLKYSEGTDAENTLWKYIGDAQFREIK